METQRSHGSKLARSANTERLRFNPFGPANSQHSLVVYRCVVEPFQIIPYSPVSLVRLLAVDLLYQVRNTLILCCSLASVAGLPLVICCPGHPKDLALCIDGIVKFLVAFPHGQYIGARPREERINKF